MVIGNPPYGAELSSEHKSFLEAKYDTFEYQVNTYVLFYERGITITSKNGMLGYITPATFTYQHYFKKLREYLQKFNQVAISKYFYEVFDDADIGDSVSWIIQKRENAKKDILIQLCQTKEDAMNFPSLISYSSIVNKSDNIYNLSLGGFDLHRFDIGCKQLVDIAEIIVGIKAYQTGKGVPKQSREIVDEKIYTSNQKLDETYIQCVIGKDFYRYRFLQQPTMYLSYGKWLAEPRESAPFFDDEKIILRQTSDSLIGHLDNERRINLNNVYNIGKKDSNFSLKYILGLLNSKLLNFIYQSISQEKGRIFAEVKKIYLAKLPIKVCENALQNSIADQVGSIIEKNKIITNLSNNFISLLNSKVDIERPSSKLENWHELDFKDFLKELQKANVKLSLSEEADWMNYFNEQKQKAQTLKAEIDKTDREIDRMVYELYGLTEEEIRIVEGAV